MRRLFVAFGLGVAVALSAAGVAQAAPAANAGAFTLTANSPDGTYAPTFTGNGMLGVRVPPSGQGYAAGTVPAQSELAGFYAWPSGSPTVSQNVQQRANIPTWSTLTFSDGGQPFTVPGPGVSNWRQSLDLHTGVVTTSARWTAPNGHVTDLTYQVLTDRASQFVGLVRMQLTPQWSGMATVTDAIDGTADTTNNPLLTNQVSKGWNTAADQDWVTVQTVGTNIQATLASQLQTSPNIVATNAPTDQSTDQSVGQQLTFPVTAGQTYTITKYVGVESSQDATDTVGAAQGQATAAANTGWTSLLAANDAAWAALWRGWIEVLGNSTLATDVNASEFYLWSSTRDGVDWSVSPAGLSSNGYDGHIFWDAETWMYPSLLAQHPDLAAGMDAYRFQRLSEAAAARRRDRIRRARASRGRARSTAPSRSRRRRRSTARACTSSTSPPTSRSRSGSTTSSPATRRGWRSRAGRCCPAPRRSGPPGRRSATTAITTSTASPDPTRRTRTSTTRSTPTSARCARCRTRSAAAHVLGMTPPASWSTIAAGLVVPVDIACSTCTPSSRVTAASWSSRPT